MDYTTKKILALDPAESCGWAWWDGRGHRECGIWNIAGGGGATLASLRSHIRYFYEQMKFDVIAYESPALGYNDWSSMAHIEKVAVIKMAAHDHGAVLHPGFAPTSLKKLATGNGKADKAMMMKACIDQFGVIPATSDEADAMFVLHGVLTGHVPESKRKKIAKARAKRAESQQGLLFGPLKGARRVIRNKGGAK